MIESPPYFHAEQAAAAVAAGKHVYLAKPIAVDVPGCLTVESSARKATAKKLCFLVDFQTRANKLYQEAVKKVHDGELGRIVLAEANYQCGPTWDQADQLLRNNPNNPEIRLRSWGVDRALSGDIITEQNIHAIDVACWMLNAQPFGRMAPAGRLASSSAIVGTISPSFFIDPNDVALSFNSSQACFGYDDIMCRLYGLNGKPVKCVFDLELFRSQDTFNSSG